MSIKRLVIILSSATLLAAAGLVAGAARAAVHSGTDQHASHRHDRSSYAKSYACPMHPEVKSDKPGKCPKCGMKLVPADD